MCALPKFRASVQALYCYHFFSFSYMIFVICTTCACLYIGMYCFSFTVLAELRIWIIVQQVIEDGGVESQEDAVEVDAEDDGVEESQDEAVEVEAEGSSDGAVLVNGNSSEEQWGTKNEEPSA